VQSQTLTPFKLFASPTRYVVPLFQRPYVWDCETQWEPLWDDVRTVAERLLESTTENPFAPPQVPPHFLGAIMLDQQRVQAGYIDVRHVIDGQQRLTTLQLLLDAAQLVLQRHGNQRDASALATLILNNREIVRSGDDVFKVWPTNHDQATFRAVMDDNLEVPADLADSRIAHAHVYFTEAIIEWCEPTGDANKTALRLSALAQTLAHYLRVVVSDLEPGDNAQVIFETLNHRGTPLLVSDLIKNLVFQRAEQEGLDVEDLYQRHWRAFDSPRWRRQVRQGRLFRPRIDIFLNDWLVMKRTREVPADRIFTDFRDYLSEPDRDLLSAVQELAASAEVYERLESLPWTSPEGTFAYRALAVMDAYAFSPFLLWLFGQPETVVSSEQRKVALAAIESWLVRCMLCRLGTKGYTEGVVDLLDRARREGPARVGDSVHAYLAAQTADATRWPGDDGGVAASVLAQPLYRAVTRARLRMVLEAIEDHYRTPKSEEEHCLRGKLTIEHVMPQGWREHWLLPSEGGDELAARRDQLIHTLGNLTLVNDRLNPALSNRPWTDDEAAARVREHKGKRSLLDHSVLMLNKHIVTGWPGSWSDRSIEARGKRVATAITSIWSRP